MSLDVTVQEVAEYAPDAPAVTGAQIEEARDWAEPLLDRAGVVFVVDSRAERAARRAVMNYALYLRTSTGASSVRVSTSGGGGIKKIKVGKIEAETVASPAGESVALNMVTSASEYLSRAWAALYGAGLPRVAHVVGVSR